MKLQIKRPMSLTCHVSDISNRNNCVPTKKMELTKANTKWRKQID